MMRRRRTRRAIPRHEPRLTALAEIFYELRDAGLITYHRTVTGGGEEEVDIEALPPLLADHPPAGLSERAIPLALILRICALFVNAMERGRRTPLSVVNQVLEMACEELARPGGAGRMGFFYLVFAYNITAGLEAKELGEIPPPLFLRMADQSRRIQ
jgi:hypothetical protein